MSEDNIEFIGWEDPVVELVGNRLLKMAAEQPEDFRRATVVVPTAGSGRRLKEYMAECVSAEYGGRKDREGNTVWTGPATALLMPRLTLPGNLISSEHPLAATDLEEFAAWVKVLSETPPHEKWPNLFPEEILEKHLYNWALNAATSLAGLHASLEKYCVTPARVMGHLSASVPVPEGESVPEAEWKKWQAVTEREAVRWREIQEIFAAVEAELEADGRIPGWKLREEEIRTLRHHRAKSVLILACLPEITPQTGEYLRAVLNRWPGTVHVWVNAPEDMRKNFDCTRFAAPNVAAWSSFVPPPGMLRDEQIFVEGSAVKMAARAVECVGKSAPDDVVLAACDTSFSPYLETEFNRRGWKLFLPEGRAMQNTDVACLPDLLAACCSVPESAQALEPLLRNTAMQKCFAKEDGWDAYAFCLLLDKLMKRYFPVGADYLQDLFDLKRRLPALKGAQGTLPGTPQSAVEKETDDEVSGLARNRRWDYLNYVQKVRDFVRECTRDLPAALENLGGMLNLRCGRGAAEPEKTGNLSLEEEVRVAGYASAVSSLAGILASFASFLRKHPMDSKKALGMLSHHLRMVGQRVQSGRRDQAHADLQGWRELPYSRGHNLILTGFHQGCVPEPVVADSFLPDSLRETLGMPCAKSREARDMFILSSLLGRRDCRVSILLSRMSADGQGSLLSPSPLLLHCPDEDLVPRVKDTLFREIPAEDDGADRKRVWRLQNAAATPTADTAGLPPADAGMESIVLLGPGKENKYSKMKFSPSKINGFLSCPLRFWMDTILGISAWDILPETKVEMEANEFGTLVHHVVEDVARRYGKCSENLSADEVYAYALQCLKQRYEERYEQNSLASMQYQLQVIRTRLKDFAEWHVDSLKEGWECYDCEHEVKDWQYTLPDKYALPDGTGLVACITMRADRIDRRPREDGNGYDWRIIDYKTHGHEPWEKHTCSVKEDDAERFESLMPGFPLLHADDGKKMAWKAWKDIQLPLYAYWLKQETGCREYPEVAYYNIPRKTGSKSVSGYNPMTQINEIEGAWDNVMEWVCRAMQCMRDGLCLCSAESLKYAGNLQSFSEVDSLKDPRNLFHNLKQL